MVETKDSKLPSAEICRRNGWGPGTKLVGDEGYGPTIIEITAVGSEAILARPISQNEVPYSDYENIWHLDNREWKALQ